MLKQILIIHGGATFDTYEESFEHLKSEELNLDKILRKDWKDSLQSKLPDFQVIYPKMPNPKNARYPEWVIWLEKIIPLLSDEVILIGHSLGAIFLAKYLSENNFPKKITQLHLVAGPYDTEVCKGSLADFALTGPVGKLATYSDKIFLYQSEDDTAVPYADVKKYQRDLPGAKLISFKDRGHFMQEDFPQLVQNISS